MLFTNKNENTTLTIRANNTVVEQKSECKFLGIIVDNEISWKPHINIQIMLKVFILGYIYAHPAYRDLMRAEGPKHIPIF